MKDSLLEKRGTGLFPECLFNKDNFILVYTEKLLIGNGLKGNKSILINNIICKVIMQKVLIENMCIGGYFANDTSYRYKDNSNKKYNFNIIQYYKYKFIIVATKRIESSK